MIWGYPHGIYTCCACIQCCYWNFTGDNYLCVEDKRLAQELSAIPQKNVRNASPHHRWLNHVCKLNSMFIGDKQNGGAVTCLGSKYHSKWWNAHSWWSNPHDLETIWNYWINLHHVVAEFPALCSPCGCRKMPLFYTADLPTSHVKTLRKLKPQVSQSAPDPWRTQTCQAVLLYALANWIKLVFQAGSGERMWVCWLVWS